MKYSIARGVAHPPVSCYNSPMTETECVLAALCALRAPRTTNEYDLHRLVAEAFKAAGLPCAHEYRLAPHRRIDFFVGGVGVEIKKGRPNARDLLKQVERYLACDELSEIIVVTQKVTPLPARVLGKRVTCIPLNRLWGVALP